MRRLFVMSDASGGHTGSHSQPARLKLQLRAQPGALTTPLRARFINSTLNDWLLFNNARDGYFGNHLMPVSTNFRLNYSLVKLWLKLTVSLILVDFYERSI